MPLALANDPSLILADEPTGNLDSENTDAMANLFTLLAERYGKTAIMASHDPKAVERFTKIYSMRDGRFVSVSVEYPPFRIKGEKVYSSLGPAPGWKRPLRCR